MAHQRAAGDSFATVFLRQIKSFSALARGMISSDGGDFLFVRYNPNPAAARVGDCAVRAVARATGLDWDSAYLKLCEIGFEMCDWGSSNAVWGAYLSRAGFKRQALPNTCPECYTVADFTFDHPAGIFVLALTGHVVTVVDGRYYDTWDSGDEIPLYFWSKEDD